MARRWCSSAMPTSLRTRRSPPPPPTTGTSARRSSWPAGSEGTHEGREEHEGHEANRNGQDRGCLPVAAAILSVFVRGDGDAGFWRGGLSSARQYRVDSRDRTAVESRHESESPVREPWAPRP